MTGAVQIARRGAVAVVTIDNPPVNAASAAVRAGLVAAVEETDADGRVHAVVLVCAGRTFVAGADISEFGKPPAPPLLPEVVAALEGAAKPWVADWSSRSAATIASPPMMRASGCRKSRSA
jgi:3-hydroxyacyl-CoA dehydrogenase